ncbi:MAG: serine hydrolase, partial [Bacteroidota bacterium]
MKNRVLSSALTLFACTMVCGQKPFAHSQPKQLDDGWKTVHLKTLGADTALAYRFFNRLEKETHKIHSILLVKDNKLVLEEYYNGQGIAEPHDLRSATKSIRSLLLGIAIDQGFIGDVDDPISQYLKHPEPTKNSDPRKKTITLKHLLTMSSGLDCNDLDKKSKGQEDNVYKKKDWIQYTLDLPMVQDPGQVSHYCSMGVVLLAEIISKASGMTIQEFAKHFLFDPLGITRATW